MRELYLDHHGVHGIQDSDFVIISVGELNTNKNHEVIIRAVAELGDPNVKYLIAGKGRRQGYLENLLRYLGIEKQVYLLGYRSDVYELLSIADVFAFPSYREGLGLAALEAMCCGLPLLTSNRHGINDYSDEGVTGYKYAPGDVAGFADGIKKLKENEVLRQVIGVINLAKVKKYGLEQTNNIMKDVYENV